MMKRILIYGAMMLMTFLGYVERLVYSIAGGNGSGAFRENRSVCIAPCRNRQPALPDEDHQAIEAGTLCSENERAVNLVRKDDQFALAKSFG